MIRRQFILSDEIVLEDLSLPGLSELKGCWHGSLDASGGGNGDTMVVQSFIEFNRGNFMPLFF